MWTLKVSTLIDPDFLSVLVRTLIGQKYWEKYLAKKPWIFMSCATMWNRLQWQTCKHKYANNAIMWGFSVKSDDIELCMSEDSELIFNDVVSE